MIQLPGRFARGVALVALVAASGALASPSAARAQGVAAPSADARPDRARLEQQVRERFARVVQQRLRLTDAQLARLQQTNARYEPKRRALVQQERAVRMALRDEAVADSAANQTHVAQLITSAIGIQRQRLDLVEEEQRELAQFLTPLQRARYLDLQEKLRQRVEQLRRGQQQQRPGGAAIGGGGQRRPFGARRGLRP